MSDEITPPVDEEQSIWEVLGIEEPADDEEDESYQEEEEEAAVEAEREDKLSKKLTARVDNLQKKFDTTMVQNAKDKFLANSSPLEKDLFKTVSADIKDMETLARMAQMVKDKAKSMGAEMERYEQEAKLDAAAKARVAWGVTGNPVGVIAPAVSDEEKALAERIAKGDSGAAMRALFGDDPKLGVLFGG